MISVPTIPIPIIPKIVTVELAYQYETKDGYANYKETSTDTNESWYGFEIGVEPGAIMPYFKERDNRTKTTSKYETSGYKDLDESRHTFSVKVVGLSIPGFSVLRKAWASHISTERITTIISVATFATRVQLIRSVCLCLSISMSMAMIVPNISMLSTSSWLKTEVA